MVGSVDVRLMYVGGLGVFGGLNSLDGGLPAGKEVEGSLKVPGSPVSVRVATRWMDGELLLLTEQPQYYRVGVDWNF